jgi:hypothetical protein
VSPGMSCCLERLACIVVVPCSDYALKQVTAEEAGGGKVILLERGAYKDMDACIMYLQVLL